MGGALLLTPVAIATLCGYLPFLYAPRYSPKTMRTVTPQRTVHCIGRYLITLPSEFELRTGGWGDIELYYGLDKNFQRVYATVNQARYTSEAFWKKVNQRRFELDSSINAKTKGPMLLHEEQISSVSAVLRRLADENYASAITSELHVLVGDRYVTLEQTSNSKDEHDITYKKCDPAPAEARMKMIASRLLPYENAERVKPGFCMQGVLFSETGQDDEQTTFRFRAKTLPDVFLDVDYYAVTGQPREGLLQRIRDDQAHDPRLLSEVATLRERQTKLDGEPAEEALTKKTHFPIRHAFGIERRDSRRRTLDRPFFDIVLTTGNEYVVPVPPGQKPPPDDGERSFYSPDDQVVMHRAADSSLSDDQVLKLWNEVVASVRKR